MSSKSLRLTAISEDLRAITMQVEALQSEAELHDLQALSFLLELANAEVLSRLEAMPGTPGARQILTIQ